MRVFKQLLLPLRKSNDMRTELIRIGNSRGIRIASSLLKQLGWELQDPIDVNVMDGKIVLENKSLSVNPFAAISQGGWYEDPRDAHEIADELYGTRINSREEIEL